MLIWSVARAGIYSTIAFIVCDYIELECREGWCVTKTMCRYKDLVYAKGLCVARICVAAMLIGVVARAVL
jgi:hypothetical protein